MRGTEGDGDTRAQHESASKWNCSHGKIDLAHTLKVSLRPKRSLLLRVHQHKQDAHSLIGLFPSSRIELLRTRPRRATPPRWVPCDGTESGRGSLSPTSNGTRAIPMAAAQTTANWVSEGCRAAMAPRCPGGTSSVQTGAVEEFALGNEVLKLGVGERRFPRVWTSMKRAEGGRISCFHEVSTKILPAVGVHTSEEKKMYLYIYSRSKTHFDPRLIFLVNTDGSNWPHGRHLQA